MGSEYFINSQELEDKVRDLLPSQGGAGAGFDLSASTQIIPIIDLTESAEGSNVRADLQSALSHKTVTSFNVATATATLVNNTGYFRVIGTCVVETAASVALSGEIKLTDGATSKIIWQMEAPASASGQYIVQDFDFIVFLKAGDSLTATTDTTTILAGSTRQIADIDGNLTNP